jgi:hypothetical protein
MRPTGPTSIAGKGSVPPASEIYAADASASSVAKQVVQRGGSSGSCCGPMPAAALPRDSPVRYPPNSVASRSAAP